jgi:8-amino-7-oxononanoate synthase
MRHDPQALRAALAELDRAQLRRIRRCIEPGPLAPPQARTILIDGRRVVNFSSNDYLGLAQHPQLTAAMCRAAEEHGVGSGASHLVTGHGVEHQRLEEALAAFTGRERALLFSTGYMANLGVIAALAGRGDLVLEDRLSHASLIDAALLSGARLQRFAHGDATAAAAALAARGKAGGAGEDAPARGALLATDGVFSMDGDLAPLAALAAAADRHGAWLVVDDAHGLGVIGAGGRGALEHFGLGSEAVPVLIGTLGKAFGTFGAFVAGSRDLIEYLLQKSRTYIYTTALPQAVAAAGHAALQLCEREPWRRAWVLGLAARFRAAAGAAGVSLGESFTPIQPVLLGEAGRALAVSRLLQERGYWVSAIRPPTVPRGSARLRVTLSAAHTEAEVDGLVAALAESLRAVPPAAGADLASARRATRGRA